MKYDYAKAAALIRKELKQNGIPARVTSEGYSMGSSINIRLLDNPLPATVEHVTEAVAKYKQGHFDGMTDMYEYSNNQGDLPQAKFVFVETEYTDEFQQLAWEHVRKTMQGGEDAPESYQKAGNYQLQGEWGHSWVHRVLSGGVFPEFWRIHKQRIAA